MDTKLKRVLFQGSLSGLRNRYNNTYIQRDRETAVKLAQELGRKLIEGGLGIILSGAAELDEELGSAAVEACKALSIKPENMIVTYRDGGAPKTGFGRVLEPPQIHWNDIRTFLVMECDAVIGLAGGKGTRDVLQKAFLARKPVFPIATIPGGAKDEYSEFKRNKWFDGYHGDLEFLGTFNLGPAEMAEQIATCCRQLLQPKPSQGVVIVHGHDDDLVSSLVKLLEKLSLQPIVLKRRANEGKSIFQKLHEAIDQANYAFVLYTPDDEVGGASNVFRARQNVIFEHGFFVGVLGRDKVCMIVKDKDRVEMPDDVHDFIRLETTRAGGIGAVKQEIARELRQAGFHIDIPDWI